MTPSVFFLDFRERDVGGAVVPGRIVVPAPPLGDPARTVEALSVHQRVVFVTHGFNVDRPGGLAQTNAFAARLDLPPDTARVAVVWPGDSRIGAASYMLEGNKADDTGAAFADFIEWALPRGTELNFISHSLGARVVFETLKRLPRGAFRVPQVCVMAPAVDDFSVSEPPVYRRPVEAAGRVAVLSSERDNVLRWAYPLGDLLQSFVFFWKDVSGLALGYHGPRPGRFDPVPANVAHVPIPASCGVDHGDYLFPDTPSALEARAVAFATRVLSGAQAPEY